MQSKSEGTSKIETSPHDFSQPILCPEPWWRSASYNSISSAVSRGTHSNSSSLDHLKEDHSESEDLVDEEVEAVNDSQTVTDGNEWGEHHNFQNETPTLLPSNEGSLMQPPQLELAGTVSLNSYPYPYVDPYYGGVMAAYGTQPLVPPHFVDMHTNNRMPLPLDVEQEPVFVNAKQYHGILRRRQSRAKMELQRKMIKNRKPYLHESRHQHAMRRARSTGGRFAKKPSNTDSLKEIAEQSNSASSSGSHSVTRRNNSHHKGKAPSTQEETTTTTTTNNNHFHAGNRGKPLHAMIDEPDRKS